MISVQIGLINPQNEPQRKLIIMIFKMRNLFFCAVLALFCISCEEILVVEDISQDSVVILAPLEDAELNSSTATFSWNAVEDADEYKLQIASPNFEAATEIVEDTTVTATSFSIALEAGDYQWRIRAENSVYESVYTTHSFIVLETDDEDISSEDVALLAPADGLVFDETDTINFSWEPLLYAESYTIQIATPNFENPIEIIENESVTVETFSISSLGANDYEWRVRAENHTYQTEYTTQSFTVEE